MPASLTIKQAKRGVPAGSLWMYVVAVLAHEPVHAYGVRVKLRERFGIRVPTSTIYTILYKLAEEGLVERESVNGETLYKASSKGLQALRDALKTLKDMTRLLEKEVGEVDS